MHDIAFFGIICAMKNMISNLFKFVKLAFSSRGADFGYGVLHGDASHVNVVDAMLIHGNVIGAAGRCIGSRETRMMKARVDGNDLRA